MGLKGLKPLVRLVCPMCDVDLKCEVRDPSGNPNNWVLTYASRQHLAEANCKPEVTPLHVVPNFVIQMAKAS